jgi:hypothetical protein
LKKTGRTHLKSALFALVFLSTSVLAHEIQLITQYIQIQRQNETGWQQDILGKYTLSRKFDLGIQGTYLERFDLYENRVGGFLNYHPFDSLTLNLGVLYGDDNEILPEFQYALSAYYAATEGVSGFLSYRDNRYSVTRLHTVNMGVELEKSGFILIPQLMLGRATLESPTETKNVQNYGIKAIYYKENIYSVFLFAHRGIEASQGIIGASNLLVDTRTGGFGGSYNFIPELKTEIIVDYTDYEQLKNQFLTTTLNLVWAF